MKQAFSLVELSIVLVILGLLTGGILAGQSLIRAAELRSITTEHNRHISAVRSFQDKYFTIPGDMLKATDFWGSVTTSGSSCTGNAADGMGTGTQTCNGNGNGWVAGREAWRFWQHLANAGLVEGSYSGVEPNDDGDACDKGSTNGLTNYYRGRLGSSSWVAAQITSSSGLAVYPGAYGNTFLLQTTGTGFGCYSNNHPILKPEEAWNIDTKMDDGKPAIGSIVATHPANCTTDATAADMNASYALSATGTLCALAFRQAF